MTDSPELSSVDGGGLINPSFQPFPYSELQGSIVDRFAKIAQRYSARAAVSDRTRQITYAELAGLVDRIAAAITQALAGREGPVAILLAKDAYYPPAMLGVLAAGRGFVPLDISHPAAQNALIATQSGAAAVLSSRDLIAGIGKQFPPGLPFLDIESMNAGAVERSLAPGPDDLACIIYTSGSTGVPKGVHHTHRTLLHSVMRRTNSLRVTHHDKVALFAPPNVVTGTRVMMTAILNGASLHVLPPQDLKPSGLVREIRARDITNFSAAPTLLRQIAEVVGPHRRLDSVAVVGLGGERIDWGDFDVFRSLCSPDALLHTGIGSTESGGHYCDWFVDEAMKATSLRMPVGRAAPDMAVTLVDEDGRPVVDGESGEVLVASRYVGLGYWRNPELTAQVFGADPAHPGARFLKTGDWARRRPDGLFEFVGRRDGQIKLRGHRIELDEVEFMLGKCDGVEDGAVVVRRDELGQPRSMAAYVEPRKDNERPRPGDLRSMLAQRLPQYMIPATVVVLDELPRLANLKLDRVQLAQIDAARVSAASPPVNDPIVAEVTAIFETVIGNVKATPDDNISSLGGDSLQSIKIACELESRFKIAIPVDVFESAQTIQELAGWLAGQSVSR